MLNRRQFIRSAVCVTSSATVTLLLALGPAGCTTDGTISMGDGTTSTTTPTIPCDGVAARSSAEVGHTHDVCVPQADLKNPPAEGVTYTTTTDEGHAHTIFVDATKLSEMDRGEIVRVTTSEVEGHVHSFALARPAAFVPPPSGGSSGGSAGNIGGPY